MKLENLHNIEGRTLLKLVWSRSSIDGPWLKIMVVEGIFPQTIGRDIFLIGTRNLWFNNLQRLNFIAYFLQFNI
jgi:hypothetical protein